MKVLNLFRALVPLALGVITIVSAWYTLGWKIAIVLYVMGCVIGMIYAES